MVLADRPMMRFSAYDRGDAGREFQLHHAAIKLLSSDVPRSRLALR